MDEDARLSDFVGGSADGDGGDDSDAADTPDATAPADPSDEPTAVTPTYRWHPDGRACDACGSVVDRAWRDDDAWVCGDCKDW